MGSKTIPGIIVTTTALVMIAEGYLNVDLFKTVGSEFRAWSIIIAAFALGLAAANLARFHLVRVAKRSSGWYHNLACLIAMFTLGITGIFRGPKAPTYDFLYTNVYSPLSVAVVALTIFFIATAALRAITARNAGATILLIAAVIIMLSNIPVGDAISPMIPKFAAWINKIPNMAGQRGILVTSAIGSIAFGLRVLLGLERTQFGAGGG
jgi:hypothetical protein